MAKQDDTKAQVADNAPSGVELSGSEQKAARKEGAKEAEKEIGKDTYDYLTNGNLPGDPPVNKWIGHDDIQLYAYILEFGVTEFEKAVAEKAEQPVPAEKVYGLLALERNGQNRTPYVKAMMKRLGLKKDELPGGGPGYTNRVDSLDDL